MRSIRGCGQLLRACSSLASRDQASHLLQGPSLPAAAYHTLQTTACAASNALNSSPWAAGRQVCSPPVDYLSRGYASQPEAASSSHSTDVGLIIDSTAVQRLKQLQAQHSDKPVFLRIEVEGGGCSGFQYKFSLDSQPASGDKVFESQGARVVCDAVSFELLRGSKIEFEDSLMRSAFVIGSNPNSEASCGCGSSFTAKTPKKSK